MGASCFINNIPLIAIIEMGVTHYFIQLDYAKILDLKLYSMVGSMFVDTPANGSITTSLVCLKCPLNIYGKIFVMDLVYLQLSQLDFILGMYQLEFNRVHINCFSKTVMFLELGRNEEFMFISSKQVEEFQKEEVHVFSMFSAWVIDKLTSVLIFQCSNKGNSTNIDLKDCLKIQSSILNQLKKRLGGFELLF